jgi:hypothetical protein
MQIPCIKEMTNNNDDDDDDDDNDNNNNNNNRSDNISAICQENTKSRSYRKQPYSTLHTHFGKY